jgi:hypothetical protein
MVDGRVVERPRGGHRFSKIQNCGLSSRAWLNWRPGGATREKGRWLIGKIEEWVCDELAPLRL